MSLEIKDIENFVNNIRNLEKAMGDPTILNISRVEETARRSLTAKIAIKKDSEITNSMIDYKRPGNAGISCADGFKILGKISKVDIPKGKFLNWSMFEN
jgi:sialic acid synthase SpsE